MRIRYGQWLGVTAMSCLTVCGVHAQPAAPGTKAATDPSYPNKPIRLIVQSKLRLPSSSAMITMSIALPPRPW